MKDFAALFFLFLSLVMPFSLYTASATAMPSKTPIKITMLSKSPRIFLIENFLSPLECDYVIEMARSELKPSKVISDTSEKNEYHTARTSQGMFIPKTVMDPIIRGIENKIFNVTRLPEENGESIQVLFYEVGGEYQPHYDYFDKTTIGGAYNYNRGGQRVATLIMYLETTEEGGETIFPLVNVKVKPIKGNAVLFYNCNQKGKEDPLTLHGGAPVIKGQKWIATKWIRKGKFQ